MEAEPQLLVVVRYPGGAVAPKRFTDVSKPIRIGSAYSCDVVVAFSGVAPLHAEVVLRGSALYVVDRSDGNLFFHQLERITRLALPHHRTVPVVLGTTGVRLDLTSGIVDGGKGLSPASVAVQPKATVRPNDEERSR